MDISSLSTEALRNELRRRQARLFTPAWRPPRRPSPNIEDFGEVSEEDSLFVPERRSDTLRGAASQTRKRRRSGSPAFFNTNAGPPRRDTTHTEDRKETHKTGRNTCVDAQEEKDLILAKRLQAEEDAVFQDTSRRWADTRFGTKAYPIDLDCTASPLWNTHSLYNIPGSSHANGNSLDPKSPKDQTPLDAAIARQLDKEELQAQEERLREATSRTRDCTVCGEAALIASLPSLSSCTHSAQVCRDCYAQWIAPQLGDNGWQEAKCPSPTCKTSLTYEEIKQYATAAVFQRYDAFKARSALSSDPDFRWCRGEGCVSGQIHDAEEVGNVFVCVECRARFCTVHEGADHADESCEEFEYRTSGQKERDERRKEEEASEKAMGRLSKKCPNAACGSPIQKNGGCNHITCWKCQHDFCYVYK
ncbi:hypothetical protein E8E13_006834 [Curvularia kusanoi]|uniref:RBR-type E3 ubiquitin transferase n=1 Tax=Curvularia kusanoi TaxID=90978 RepID=A0A9P4WBU8_CURKU|nr:hypothetical protein E8E13_006834 [Curvularia kusanoi]